MSKHTEGPWRVGESCHNILTVKKYESPLGDMRSKMIASAYTIDDVGLTCKSHEELTANARLMAAAPELLEALKLIFADDTAQSIWNPNRNVRAIALAAIAKAEGSATQPAPITSMYELVSVIADSLSKPTDAAVMFELLEALRGMIDMATDNRTHGPEIDAACEAIAKAEGRFRPL